MSTRISTVWLDQLEPTSCEDVVGWSIFLFSCLCLPSVFWTCVVHFPCLCRLGVSCLNSRTSPLLRPALFTVSPACTPSYQRQIMCGKLRPVSSVVFLTTIWFLLPGSPATLRFDSFCGRVTCNHTTCVCCIILFINLSEVILVIVTFTSCRA